MKNATLKQAIKMLSIFEDASSEQIQAIIKSGILADIRDGNLDNFNRNEIRKILGLKALDPTLLKFAGIAAIPATTEKFVAREHFIEDTSKKTRVKILHLSDSFMKWFSDKVEYPFAGSMVDYKNLLKHSIDKHIINELGGKIKAETSLTEMFALMEKQANGEDGALLVNGKMNIFYVCDINDVLRAVYCIWDDDGWFVFICKVGLGIWNNGDRVFSRSSL